MVLDYRGYRITAQSIIPGILEREQEQSVVYGSIDFGKTVVSSPKYLELLQKAGGQLKILPHSVLNDSNEEVSYLFRHWLNFVAQGFKLFKRESKSNDKPITFQRAKTR